MEIEDPREREQRFGQHDHVRLYGLDYPERLRAAGLLATPRNFAARYRREGVNPEEDLFIARPAS